MLRYRSTFLDFVYWLWVSSCSGLVVITLIGGKRYCGDSFSGGGGLIKVSWLRVKRNFLSYRLFGGNKYCEDRSDGGGGLLAI